MTAKDDLDIQSLAIYGKFCGFDLAEFDGWLAELEQCAAKVELTARRHAALLAMSQKRLEAVRPHLEFLHMGMNLVRRDEKIQPLVNKEKGRVAQARTAAKQSRPGAMDRMRAAVIEMMAPHHRAVSFKDFMAAWELDPLDGLRLTEESGGGAYTVDDENGGLGSKQYTNKTLAKMFSES